MNKLKKAFFRSVCALTLCVSMLVGTTFAWFTDTVSSKRNVIATGKLDVELEYHNGTDWSPVEEDTVLFDQNALWEPGYTDVVYLKVSNEGSLALKYQLGVNILREIKSVNKNGDELKLSDHIKFGVVEGVSIPYATRDLARAAVTQSEKLSAGYSKIGTIFAGAEPQYVALVVYMPEETGSEANYAVGAAVPEIELGIGLAATQLNSEADSFGTEYDSQSPFPNIKFNNTVTANISVDANGTLADSVSLVSEDEGVSAHVPEGVLMEEGATSLTFTIRDVKDSEAEITLDDGESTRSVDVHIEGIAEDNTVPILVTVKQMMPVGLNIGNYKFYHVEDGITNLMTLVDVPAAHNEFSYDPATGDVTMMLQSFSEVAMVADTENAWEGNYDYTWYTNSVEESGSTEYIIANADQLAGLGDIVSGSVEDIEQDNFEGKTIKLVSDINIGLDSIWYPIGYHKEGSAVATIDITDKPEAIYYVDEESAPKQSPVVAIAEGDTTNWYTYGGAFKGTFDGNGHKISNIYQNTWQMKGNYDGNYWNEAMGVFGYVYGGTIRNLTVDNFSSDGEFTPTGVITAYAAGKATFENIAITNCNPRVYNTGNGGIIGVAGDTSVANDDHITLKNITVDNSNKISALWGSWDVACGGLVGMYRGNVDGSGNATGDTISFENCHVSAVIDVYNDVCANYQYYAYRYSGMIIGSVRHNAKNAEGKTIPNMKGISATGCTVNYGDWNDYYYCEFEKNTMASYSEDYQFSRVSHSELNFTDSNGNGVVDADERASVTGCKHTHTAEENYQAVYLPFHQLFTGYSWGVSSIGLEELEGIENITVKIGPEKSEKKFGLKEINEVINNKKYKVSDFFTALTESSIVDSGVVVTITKVDEEGTVGGTYTANKENWEEGTIEFNIIGDVKITIQDYNFCIPTTITVNVTERLEEPKFETNFTGEFLYRVGNENTVALETLFKSLAGEITSDVSVTIENISGNASGVYTANNTWSNGTIQFNGTGVVKVTITDNNYCIPTELTLEVIDATNLTSAIGTITGGDFVLLSDVNTSTYVNYWNCTLYGNGFTYSLKGAPTSYNSKQGHGVLITKNATLDNLVIIGDVYNSYGAYTTQDYYNAAVDVVGDTVIQNCYIANCAAPVSTREDVTIINTTLYRGAVANLIIKSGTATLEDVTTVNYDDGRAVVGMGIVIHSDATESAKLILNGTLTQYNFISESKVPTDSYAKNLHTAMFDDSCEEYHFGISPNRYVNTGIISLTSTFNADDIKDNANTGYKGKELTKSSYNSYVYTQLNTSGSVNNDYNEKTDGHVANTQGLVAPAYSFDYTTKNYMAKTDGSNDYCYEENGTVYISMDEGDTFNWDTSIFKVSKEGQTLTYTVSMEGIDYTGKSIAFNTAGDYTVKYTYIDDKNNKLDAEGNIETYSVTYTKEINITVAVVKATTKHAEFTFGSSNTASTTVTVGNNTYVMPNVSGTSSTIGSTTVDGKTIYYPIVEIVMSDGKTSHTSSWYAYFPVFSGTVTIIDYEDKGTGDKMTPYNGSTTTMPSGLSIVGDPAQLFKYQSSSTAGTSPVVKNNILVYSSPSISAKRSEYNTVIQYSYQDNAGATYYYYIGYHAPAQSYSSICVTPDTLVTLADGTQKEIQYVTVGENLKAWNFHTASYEAVPASLVQNHGTGLMNVLYLNFSDGTTLKILGEHGVFDVNENTFVFIDEDDVHEYVGHEFIKCEGHTYKKVKLVDYSVKAEYTTAYTILSTEHYNCLLEDMFTVTPAVVGGSFFTPFEIHEGMKYDKKEVLADIAKYGLYTYEEFKHVLTYNQFIALNIPQFKVSVGKGIISHEGLMWLIETFIVNK